MGEHRYRRSPDGYVVSPKRQAKKARGLSSRQERKLRKKLAREGFSTGRQDKFGNTVYEF